MTLYFYTGRKDLAATTLADLVLLIAALADESTAANQATIRRVTAKVETLVQNDSGEPLNLYFYDDATTAASWVTDAGTTLAVGLGDPSPGASDIYASTTSFSISGSSRVGTLALNTTRLADALSAASGCNGANAFGKTLHIRKTTAGVTETVGLIQVLVRAGVIPTTPGNMTETSYVTTTEARTGYVINLSAVTSLTGGGAAALDGIDAGSDSFPVGCIAILSISDIPQHCKLKGTYIAASDVAAGLIKPTNSDATLNPVHWQILF